MGGGGLYALPPFFFAFYSKYLAGIHTWAFLTLQTFLLRMSPWKKNKNLGPPPPQSTLKYRSKNRPWARGLSPDLRLLGLKGLKIYPFKNLNLNIWICYKKDLHKCTSHTLLTLFWYQTTHIDNFVCFTLYGFYGGLWGSPNLKQKYFSWFVSVSGMVRLFFFK